MNNRHAAQQGDRDALLIHALERAPQLQVPADFASRVLMRVPQQRRRATLRHARVLAPHYGRKAAYTALLLLAVGLLLVTRFTTANSTWISLQCVLLVQLCAVAMWISFASWRSQ